MIGLIRIVIDSNLVPLFSFCLDSLNADLGKEIHEPKKERNYFIWIAMRPI